MPGASRYGLDMPEFELDRLTDLSREFVRMRLEIEETVERAREKGASWQQIADALGMSRQGAQQRYSKGS